MTALLRPCDSWCAGQLRGQAAILDQVGVQGQPAPHELIACDPTEPFAANALRIGNSVLHAAAWQRTRERLEASGIAVVPVDASELAKAEAGVTCCSVVFSA